MIIVHLMTKHQPANQALRNRPIIPKETPVCVFNLISENHACQNELREKSGSSPL